MTTNENPESESMRSIPYQRILIYGVTGSGKTTLADHLSAILGVTWHSVDDLSFEANWVSVPDEEQRRRIEKICSGDQWILDTAYGTWLDVPLARADLIVGLDYPRWLSLTRLIRRTIARVVDGRLVCNGNRETLKGMFSKQSILVWHFKSFARKRERIRKWKASAAPPEVVHIKSRRELNRWLQSLR